MRTYLRKRSNGSPRIRTNSSSPGSRASSRPSSPDRRGRRNPGEESSLNAKVAQGRAWIGGLLLLYVAASLLHFAHNAEYLADYPNLPAWLGRADVYHAWLGLAAIGAGGWALYRTGKRLAGLLLIGAYAVFGFDGLLHYTRAPVAAHTFSMNFTIWLEVAAAGLLLTVVLMSLAKRSG